MGKKRDRGGGSGLLPPEPEVALGTVGHAADGRKKKRQKEHREDGAHPQPKSLPPHKYILAPMVGGSELAFRMLCRRYATKDLLCYTPMMNSTRFAAEEEYREEIFSTLPEDRPLVGHFCGNDPQTLLKAARLIESQGDAVDLNLGCPQRIAHSGHFGSFLLDDVDRPLVCAIVRTLAQGLTVPVFCKIRLLATTEETIGLVSQLRDAGASLVAVHARHRVSLVGRSGPVARDGPALLDEVVKVRRAVQGVQIVSNGNVRCWDDVRANLTLTGADGIMSAEGMLDDPALYLPSAAEPCSGGGGGAPFTTSQATAGEQLELQKTIRRVEKKLREIERLEGQPGERMHQLSNEETLKVARREPLQKELKKARKALKRLKPQMAASQADCAAPLAESARSRPSSLELALEYLNLAATHPVGAPLKTLAFHVRRMAKESLTQYQLLSDVLEAETAAAVRAVVERAIVYERDGFTPDPEKAKRERQALELKKWREATRKRFEERMVRKALRTGLPADHYLSQGAEVPTRQSLEDLKAMDKPAAWAVWQSKHKQHCWALHMEEGGCQRERTCAFLHADIGADVTQADQELVHG